MGAKREPLSMTVADHFGDDVVRVTFSDGSTACMTVAQYDAIVDWGMEVATRDRERLQR
jgi:hypothetical protein